MACIKAVKLTALLCANVDDGSEIVPVNNATRSLKPSLTEEELNEQKAQREEALHSFIAELELISSAVAISDTEDDDAGIRSLSGSLYIGVGCLVVVEMTFWIFNLLTV